MILEPGDLFVVTRGREYGSQHSSLAVVPSIDGENWKQKSRPKEYDRTHNGKIYKALSVVDDLVAAECVHARPYASIALGERISLHLSEIEIMTVPPEYLDALKGDH